jgi:serine/threonine protein kinase
VSSCSFSSFDGWIEHFKNIEVLFASNMPIKSMPDLTGCTRLRMVGMKSCGMSEWREGRLPKSVEAVTLTDNNLKLLPEKIARELPALKKLMLTGNRLDTLPKDFQELQRLEILRLSNNSFTAFPEQLRDLPQLRWYVDSGNPYNNSEFNLKSMITINENELTIGKIIGKSSKNSVQITQYNGGMYAYKKFGPGMTTDGTPESEVAAMMQAKHCKSIVRLIVPVVNEDGELSGMLMEYIDDSYKPLAKPPDFETFTRDIYPEDMELSKEFVKKCISSVQQAVSDLHSKNIAHGDIYAHNILVDEDGDAILVDFGSATEFYESLRDFWDAVEHRAVHTLKDELELRVF